MTALVAAAAPGDWLPGVTSWLPFLLVIVLVVAGLRVADLLLLKRPRLSLEERLPRQITMLVLTTLGVVLVILALPGGEHGPVSDQTRGDLLGLVGLGVTALITLSSTTLAANAMAGLMLRATAPFKGGDWVRAGEHFGRVTQRGLFHTEIQTEDRDLMSLPNLFLATNPVRIVQERGTIVSAEVSLGYDVAHDRAEALLVRAAEEAGLVEPFVWITDLRDHAVVYRAAGTLEEVKGLISARSRLRTRVLDVLHGAGVEIASPQLVIQRRGGLDDVAIPPAPAAAPAPEGADAPVEERVFDKAEEAARADELEQRLAALEAQRHESGDDARAALEAEMERLQARIAALREAPGDGE